MKNQRRELFSFRWVCAALTGLVLLAGCATPPSGLPAKTGSGWIQDEVADSYVFGYPLLLMSAARDDALGTGPGQAQVNVLRHARALPSSGALNPMRPSLDTLDSTGWLDLGAEPIVLSLPNSGGRYVDARVLDMWTNVIWSSDIPTAPRITGIKAQSIAFVGPGWSGTLPRGVRRVEAPTRYLWVNLRIQANGRRDISVVRKLQRAIRVTPLAIYAGERRAASVVARSDRPETELPDTPAAQIAALNAADFFGRLAQALADNPPVPADPDALQTLADIGVKPGLPVRLPRDASSTQTAPGLALGRERVASPPSNLMSGNGWLWFGDDVGQYGKDYALRAYAAYAQPGIGTRHDEVRATVQLDNEGQKLNGARRYVLHFAPNQLPPVRGFWSLTAYMPDGALASGMPEQASVIGDRRGVRRNADGSLDVVVSAVRQKAGNWLAAPRGEFQLMLRLYAPKPQATDGTWQPPAVTRR